MIGARGHTTSEITTQIIRSLALIALLFCPTLSPSSASAGVFVSISVPPPPLPVYVQPIAPGPNFIWAPGYWAYDDADYYWVPGTWVRAPAVGLLWTPGYWGWNDGFYVWHAGYWGPHVGFYGGINYGCGYTGSGYWGGHWDHGTFYYNTAVTHVNTTLVHNTYNTVIVNKNIERVSFNGGQGGISAKPSSAEIDAGHEHHVPPTSLQVQHQHVASTEKASFASVNHGSPHITATARAGAMPGHKIESLKSANLASQSQQPSKALASLHSNSSSSNFQHSQISSHEHRNMPPNGASHSPKMAAHHGQGHERPAGPPHQGKQKKEHG